MISFVGAGPGAADLLTLRAVDRLAHADVVVWASSLVPDEVLTHVRPDADVHDSAGMTLEDVLAVYAAAGPDARIVRLHSGDLSLYSAIGEQIDWCVREERDFELVPGVGSLAAAVGAGRTRADRPRRRPVAGRHPAPGPDGRASMPDGESVAAFAPHGTTMAVYLSAARPDELRDELLVDGSGYRPDTPAAVVVRATWPDEQVVLTTVDGVADAIRSTGARTTVLVLVGDALAGATARTRLYDPCYAHGHRRRSRPGDTEGRPRTARPPAARPATGRAPPAPTAGEPAP